MDKINIENRLDQMNELEFLDLGQVGRIKKLGKDLIHGFTTRQIHRPKYLMEVSVLKNMKFSTPDAKYWQCILERDVQLQNLLMLFFDFEEKIADIEIRRANIQTLLKKSNKGSMISKAESKKLEIQNARDSAMLFYMKKEAIDRVREIINWSDIIQQIGPDMKYSKDDPEEHMPESFLLRVVKQKMMIQEIGATDMSGAMNIMGLADSAFGYLKKNKPESKLLEGI